MSQSVVTAFSIRKFRNQLDTDWSYWLSFWDILFDARIITIWSTSAVVCFKYCTLLTRAYFVLSSILHFVSQLSDFSVWLFYALKHFAFCTNTDRHSRHLTTFRSIFFWSIFFRYFLYRAEYKSGFCDQNKSERIGFLFWLYERACE